MTSPGSVGEPSWKVERGGNSFENRKLPTTPLFFLPPSTPLFSSYLHQQIRHLVVPHVHRPVPGAVARVVGGGDLGARGDERAHAGRPPFKRGRVEGGVAGGFDFVGVGAGGEGGGESYKKGMGGD